MKTVILASLVLFALPDDVSAGTTPVIPPQPPIVRNSSDNGAGNFQRALQSFVEQNPNSLLRGLVPNGNQNGTPSSPEQVRDNVITNLTRSNIISGANDPQVVTNQFPPFGGTTISPSNVAPISTIVIPPISF